MGYINSILKGLIALLLISAATARSVKAQTCCSGGVPLSGNIGFEGSERGTLQMELSYDLNYLSTLKYEAEVYEDPSRQRTTHSILWKSGYSLTNWLAVDGLLSYVIQGRQIAFGNDINEVQTNGVGDAVVIAKLLLSRISENNTEIQLGAGPKIPLGKSDLTDSRGITLNADLQPGSGSWDLVTWAYLARQLNVRPSLVVSGRVVARLNGVNRAYLGHQHYRFGNSLQFYAGIGDQLVFANNIFSMSVSLRYRKALADRINDHQLDNTGGQWINIIPAIGWNIGPKTILNMVPEIPLYSRVDGTQLTPTFRIQAGIYHRIGGNKRIQINTEEL